MPSAESQVKYKMMALKHFIKEHDNLQWNPIAPGFTYRWTLCTAIPPTGGKAHKQPQLKCLSEAQDMHTQKLKIALDIYLEQKLLRLSEQA